MRIGVANDQKGAESTGFGEVLITSAKGKWMPKGTRYVVLAEYTIPSVSTPLTVLVYNIR